MHAPLDYVTTRDELRAIYRQPHGDVLRKEMKMLDAHSKTFLRKSPFVLIGTQDLDGAADVSPKGDRPGFVVPLDDVTLAIPDRPGNNRLDSWENVLRNPAVGLIFLIPGMNETLRVNGTGGITVDRGLCERLAVDERPAISVLIVKIGAVYMHCAKAFIRSQLWSPQTWPDRAEMPTLGRILRDQLALAESAEDLDGMLANAYEKTLW